MGKKDPSKQYNLNIEIIELLSEFSDYIHADPMVLFYCLYFCIYFNNSFIVEFLRTLIEKLPEFSAEEYQSKFSVLLDQIDVNGIERLRQSGESINQRIYHIVFYQAMDDQLRVVYSQILHKLRFL